MYFYLFLIVCLLFPDNRRHCFFFSGLRFWWPFLYDRTRFQPLLRETLRRFF